MVTNLVSSFIIFAAILLLKECNGRKAISNTFSKDRPPAIFIFGDSLSDTGNAIEAFPFYADAENFPYGSTFFGAPSGRFSDGRLIIDFIATKLGFQFIDHYFKNLGPNYQHGINFAVSGAMAQNVTEPVPFFLPLQTDHFVRFKRNVYASLNSTHETGFIVPGLQAFEDGIYMIFIGVNDILSSFFMHNLPPSNVKATTVPPVIAAISKAIQDLNKEGAKNFMVFNILPIGCTPMVLTLASQGPFNATDQLGCLQQYNDVVNYANVELDKSLGILKRKLEDTSIMVVDMYGFYMDAITRPAKYGFKESEMLKACCGYGGDPFNYNLLATCGANIAAAACSNPSEYVSWDGLHFTDAFNHQFVEEVIEKRHYLKAVLA